MIEKFSLMVGENSLMSVKEGGLGGFTGAATGG